MNKQTVMDKQSRARMVRVLDKKASITMIGKVRTPFRTRNKDSSPKRSTKR